MAGGEGLLSIFLTAILPIVTIAAVGFVLGRTKAVDPDPMNTVTVYVLAPALVFHSIATTSLGSGTLARMAVGVVAFVGAMTLVAEVVGRVFDVSDAELSALVLVTSYSNSGNLGIPVSDFAFPEVGRSTAVVYLVVQSVLVYTHGVYVASRTGGESGLAGVKRIAKIPLVYAVVAALLARWAGAVPPADTTTMQTLELVGNAAIPLMLLILGIQLSQTDYGAALSRVGVPAALKLGVAPVVAVGIALVLGFGNPDVGRVFVLESATPSAITPLILLIEFGGDTEIDGLTVPEYVSTVVMVTTLVSVLTLTVVIALMKAGVVL